MVRYVHPGEELAVQIKQGIRAADVANTASGTEKARTRDSTIIDLLEEFAVTLSPTVEPSSGWSSVAPPWVAGEYVWKRTTTTYGDGATAVGPALLATGNDGEPGAPGTPGTDGAPGVDGADGAPGRSVALVDVMYYLSTSATALAGGTWLTDPPAWVDGRYMWTKTVTTYSTGTPTETDPVNITGAKGSAGAPGSDGADGSDGSDGVGITSTVVTYQGHTAGVMPAPTGAWAASPPAVAAGNYLWTRTVITYTNSSTSIAYSVARMGADGSTGTPGSPGAPGDDGRSVTSIVEQYYLSTSSTAQAGGSWGASVPAWVDGRFYWTRSVITYDKGSPLTVTTTPVMVSGGKGATGTPGADGRGITGTVVDYQVSASGTVAPSTWLSTIPAVPAGQFLWTRTITSYTTGTPTTAYSVGRSGTNGANGSPGTDGTNGQTSYLHVAYATNSTGTDGFSTTDPSGKTYMGTYTDFTAADSTNPALYAWSLIKGADGATGGTGPTGTGISGSAVTYQAHTSGTATPTGAWLTTVPAVAAGSFLWTRTIINFTDGASTTTYSVARMGVNGSNGTNGADGRGIASTSVMYQAGTSGTSAPTGTWVASVPAVAAGQFLWTRTVFTYTSGSPATTTEYSVGRMGENGANGAPGTPGSDGRGVTGAVTTYQASASGTAVPTGSWLTNPPAVSPGQFLWSRTVTSYTSGVNTNAYSVARQGATGAPGSAGVSVSSSTMFYWLGATQPAAPTVLTPPAPWSATEPTYTPGTSSNLYVVVRTVLSSGAFSYSTVSMSASFAAAKSAFGKYTFSAAAPVVGDGAGKPVGAMWVRKSVAGEINGYWEWSGSAWQARPLSQDIIPLIVAGMISAGAIDGMTITGAEIIAYAGGNAARAILKNGALTFDFVGSPGAGTMTLGPGGITSTDSDSRFRISKLSAAPGVGLDIVAGTGGGNTASILMDGASGGKINLNAAKVTFSGDTDGWVYPTTVNGTNNTTRPIRYKIVNRVLFMGGRWTPSANNQTAFTLPIGSRPEEDCYFWLERGGSQIPTLLQADGQVRFVGPGGTGHIEWAGAPRLTVA